MRNAVAEVWEKTINEVRIAQIMEYELNKFKKEIIPQLQENQANNSSTASMPNIDYNAFHQLSKKMDQLHSDVRNLEKSCDSLFKALCKFK